MGKFITSWKWIASAMAAMLVFGLTVSANAQDAANASDANAQEKSIEEMQKQILQLEMQIQVLQRQSELNAIKARMGAEEAANGNDEVSAARSRDDASDRPAARRQIPRQIPTMTSGDRMKTLAGKYLGMEGDDWFGIVIEEPKDGTSVITFYEDGLPEHGYKPKDDDKYVGTATINEQFSLSNEFPLFITLNQKFDGQREEFVEPDLRKFTAQVTREDRNDGTMPPAIKIVIPRNREWDDVIVERAISELNGMIPGKSFLSGGLRRAVGGVPSPATPWTPEAVALIGRYLGHEGDDRMGMVLSQSRGAKLGTYNVIFYDDGLPGAGHNRRDDDRYEGTAVLAGDNGDRLEISITRQFDGERQERVEQPLQKMTAQLIKDQAGNMMVRIPHNGEWDEVLLKKL